MSRYQYLITAPKIEGLSAPMIDRFDIAFGLHLDRWADDLVLTPEAQALVKRKVLHDFPDVTDEQINKAFVEFCRSREDYYDGRYLAQVHATWKNMTDLETKMAEIQPPTIVDNGNVLLYPLDKIRISQLITKLHGEDIPSAQKEQMDDSLLLDIFSEDELEIYQTGFSSSYHERQLVIDRLRKISDEINFDTTYVYLSAED